MSDSDDAEMASDQGVCVSRGTSKDSTKKEPRRKRELRSLEQSSSSEQGAKKATRGQYQQRDHLARLFSISANTTEWHTLLGTLKACEYEHGIAPERAGEIMRKAGRYLPKDQVLAHEQEIQRAHQQRERQAAEQERLRYGHLLDEIEIARGMASAEPSHPLIRMKVMRGVSEADAVADMRSIGEQRLAAAQQQLAECGLTVEAPVAA